MNKSWSDVINHKSDVLVVCDIMGTQSGIYKIYHALSKIIASSEIKMFRILFLQPFLHRVTHLQQI